MTIKRVALGSVTEKVDYGLTASATERNTGIKLLRITDIQDDSVNWHKVPYCDYTLEEAQRCRLQQGDIVFARTGATTGKSYLIDKFPKGAVFASYLIRVRPKHDELDPQFLSYFFRTSDYWLQISGSAVGAAQLGFNATKLKGLVVPLPPLPEQQRIAAILAKADRLRRLRHTARELGDTYLQSVFLEMFGDGSKSKTKKLGELLHDNPKNGLYLPAEKYGSGTPIIRINNFYEGMLGSSEQFKRVRATSQQIREFAVVNGEILINRVNSIEYLGKCAFVQGLSEPTVFESNMMRVRADMDVVLPIYLVRFLTSQQAYSQILQRARKAVNQASINQQDVKSLAVPVPPLPLQQQFAAAVRQFERLRAQQREGEREAEHLFQTLLHRAFRGEL